MIKNGVLFALCVCVVGCPNGGALPDNALLHFTNTLSHEVLSIRLQGVGDTAPRDEQLTSNLAQGDSVAINLAAPQHGEGTVWRVVVVFGQDLTNPRTKTGTFSCLHEGDVINWEFMGDEPSICVD